MQVYLVGGAVRDELLGRAGRRARLGGGRRHARGAAARRAIAPSAVNFRCFCIPDTHEEYALARLERKTGPGYRGFATQFSPEVTLEQDLQRRDLTINAMARATPTAR